ncbi:hypothetical protein IWX91DRAFT_324041 [Phyllosticta citricarpa]
MYETKKREADHTTCDPISLSVEECVAQIIAILDQTPGIKVIDALYECDPFQRHTIRGALDDVVRQSSKPIMIFASSRDNQDIIRRMGHAREVFISTVDNDNDIRDSVATEVESAVKNGRILGGSVSAELQNEIIKTLMNLWRNISMLTTPRFRWASLQIQNICNQQRFKLESDVREELGKLPTSLKESYAVIYEQILNSGPHSKRLAQEVFSWIICQREPLTFDVFFAAIFAGHQVEESIKISDVLNVCCNLVVQDERLGVFRFAHLSVLEFLSNLTQNSPSKVNLIATKACTSAWSARNRHLRVVIQSEWKTNEETRNLMREFSKAASSSSHLSKHLVFGLHANFLLWEKPSPFHLGIVAAVQNLPSLVIAYACLNSCLFGMDLFYCILYLDPNFEEKLTLKFKDYDSLCNESRDVPKAWCMALMQNDIQILRSLSFLADNFEGSRFESEAYSDEAIMQTCLARTPGLLDARLSVGNCIKIPRQWQIFGLAIESHP